MDDVVVKNYKLRSAQGEIFNNPMSKLVEDRSLIPIDEMEMYDPPGSQFQIVRGNFSGPGSSDPYHDRPLIIQQMNHLEDLAVTAAFAKVGASQVNALVELAELRETISFLMSPLRSLVSLAKRANRYSRIYERVIKHNQSVMARWRKRGSRGRKPRLKPLPTFRWGKIDVVDIPSTWLAYRYAAMPIIYTVDDISKALEKSVAPERVTVRSHEATQLSESYVPYSDSGPSIDTTVTTTLAYDLNVRAGVLYVPEYSLLNTWGVQFHQIPAALYETIPLSFIADWFHNGSEFYQALTAELRVKRILAGWVTSTVNFEAEGVLFKEATAPYTTVTGNVNVPIHKTTGTYVRRTPKSINDIRMALRIDMSNYRVADAFALCATFLNKWR
jgi:hypothetical protein